MNSYLKWSGGKNSIRERILAVIEHYEPDVFIEPFCGALNIGANVDCKEKHLNDINFHAINVHGVVRDYPQKLIDRLKPLYELGYESYYDIRDKLNNFDALHDDDKADLFDLAAWFIYLNRHGFNGLSRYNKSGKFNTPVGRSPVHTAYFPEKEIWDYHEKLNRGLVKLYNEDYTTMFDQLNEIDNVVIYSDSPYLPLTTNFNYTADGFDIEDQKRLARLAEDSKHTVIISNHDTPVARELYKNATKIISFPVQRNIAAKGKTRKKVMELVAIYE